MKISKLSYEGTPEEFAAVADLFAEGADVHEGTAAVYPSEGTSQPRRDLETIRRVLGRIAIPEGQKALYHVLYDAGDRVLSAGELANAMRITVQELNGVLGALGRRVNGTAGIDGKPGINLLLDVEKSGGEWHYHMPQETRSALEKERLV
jgi:hypothetical protein